jgi:rabenosyn-5
MLLLQVLIRLEKLMTNLPSDPGKRRAHERAAVSWVEEDLVKLCPYCARSFNVAARRKHHCR